MFGQNFFQHILLHLLGGFERDCFFHYFLNGLEFDLTECFFDTRNKDGIHTEMFEAES